MAESQACLLLPGTLCDGRLFEPLLQHWPAGASARPRIDDFERLESGVSSWCERVLSQAEGPMDVVGFSLGGLLALRLIALAPQRIRNLVLIATNAQAATPAHRERTEQHKALWQASGPLAVARDLLEQSQAAATLSPAAVQTVEDMAQSTPWARFVAQCELNASRPEGFTALSRWEGRLLLISGEQDPWCGQDKQVAMQQARPDAHWVSLPQCGHYIPLAQPERLAQALHAFFQFTPQGLALS